MNDHNEHMVIYLIGIAVILVALILVGTGVLG